MGRASEGFNRSPSYPLAEFGIASAKAGVASGVDRSPRGRFLFAMAVGVAAGAVVALYA
jgi:hypothetical protein